MQRIFLSGTVVVVFGYLALSSWTASATIVKAISLDTIVESSSIIFHGIVRHVDDDLSMGPTGPFRTRIRFEIIKPLKGGDSGDLLFELVLPGGRAGDKVMRISGMPRFDTGQEVIVCLEKTRKGYALTGLFQGVFFVEESVLGKVVAPRQPELAGSSFSNEVLRPILVEEFMAKISTKLKRGQ